MRLTSNTDKSTFAQKEQNSFFPHNYYVFNIDILIELNQYTLWNVDKNIIMW